MEEQEDEEDVVVVVEEEGEGKLSVQLGQDLWFVVVISVVVKYPHVDESASCLGDRCVASRACRLGLCSSI